MKRRALSSLVCITALVVMGVALWVHAGNLTPPAGPVAPTMKTLDQISNQIAALPGGTGPIKRIIHGMVTIAKDASPPFAASEVFSPPIDPARSMVVLSDAVATDLPVSCGTNGCYVRSSACVESLTTTQLTVRVDNNTNLTGAKVSYQIVEYN